MTDKSSRKEFNTYYQRRESNALSFSLCEIADAIRSLGSSSQERIKQLEAEIERLHGLTDPPDNLKEKLAEYAHEIRSDWIKYSFGKCPEPLTHGGVMIPTNFVERWTQLMSKPYAELSLEEKEVNQKIADKMIRIMYGE